MFIVKALVALVIGAIVYVVIKPIAIHFNFDIIWAYIIAVICAFAYYFGAPELPWKH